MSNPLKTTNPIDCAFAALKLAFYGFGMLAVLTVGSCALFVVSGGLDLSGFGCGPSRYEVLHESQAASADDIAKINCANDSSTRGDTSTTCRRRGSLEASGGVATQPRRVADFTPRREIERARDTWLSRQRASGIAQSTARDCPPTTTTKPRPKENAHERTQ